MHINILSSVAGKSSEKLKQALQAAGHVAMVNGYHPYIDWFFSYGSTQESWKGSKRVNHVSAIKRCIDKVKTFKTFNRFNIPTVEWTDKQRIPEHWDQVVVRTNRMGRKGEDIDYFWNQGPKPAIKGELYTRVFYWKKELRVTVFMGHVVGVYDKKEVGDEVEFHPVKRVSKALKEDAVKAARALGIDYVGFDVLVGDGGDYRFLEANSAPLLTDEACDAIVAFFNKEGKK
jgi:glutathione synthase/RimK-type ligase-like ATP-grasp enzyme